MKDLIARAAAFITTLAFAYLVGAFIAVDWNLATWSGEGRTFTALLGVAGAVGMAALAPHIRRL